MHIITNTPLIPVHIATGLGHREHGRHGGEDRGGGSGAAEPRNLRERATGGGRSSASDTGWKHDGVQHIFTFYSGRASEDVCNGTSLLLLLTNMICCRHI